MSSDANEQLPENIVNYVSTYNFETIVNNAVNTVLKKRPIDPLSDMAMMLLQASGTSFPTFDRF
jgi:hypothetical protein